LEANKLVQPLLAGGEFIHQGGQRADADQQYQGLTVVESTIGEGAELGKKANIRKSVLGSNCQVGQSCKVDNSVLMDGVKLAAGAQVKNSIVCRGVELGEKAELQMCIVANGYRVEGKKKFANEVLCEEQEINLYE